MLLIYLFFILGIPLGRHLTQHSKTADLCHQVPTDGSDDFAGTLPTRVLSRLSPSPTLSHLGSLWLPLSYSARDAILCIEKKAGTDNIELYLSLVLLGSSNRVKILPPFYDSFGFQEMANQAKESSLADREQWRTYTFPQWLPCFMKSQALYSISEAFLNEYSFYCKILNKSIPLIKSSISSLSQKQKAIFKLAIF